jgi:hypothetical protein
MVKAKDEPAVLQLTIQTDKTQYPKGSSVPIHIRVTNVSRRDVIVWEGHVDKRITIACSTCNHSLGRSQH